MKLSNCVRVCQAESRCENCRRKPKHQLKKKRTRGNISRLKTKQFVGFFFRHATGWTRTAWARRFWTQPCRELQRRRAAQRAWLDPGVRRRPHRKTSGKFPSVSERNHFSLRGSSQKSRKRQHVGEFYGSVENNSSRVCARFFHRAWRCQCDAGVTKPVASWVAVKRVDWMFWKMRHRPVQIHERNRLEIRQEKLRLQRSCSKKKERIGELRSCFIDKIWSNTPHQTMQPLMVAEKHET